MTGHRPAGPQPLCSALGIAQLGLSLGGHWPEVDAGSEGAPLCPGSAQSAPDSSYQPCKVDSLHVAHVDPEVLRGD